MSGVLAGRRVLVIGVETPAGGVIARALGLAGAAVGLATMRADEGVLVARRIQRELQAAGGTAATYAFDITLGQNVKVSTRQVTKELGGLDLVVSAPDRFFAAPLGRTTDSDLAAVMTSNCYAHLFAVRAAADEFARGGGGRALLVTHAAGEAALAGAIAYAAAHAAALGLARSLAEELRPQHIAVDALVVGRAAWSEGPEPRALVPTLDAAASEALAQLAVEVCAAGPDGESGRVLRLGAGEPERTARGG